MNPHTLQTEFTRVELKPRRKGGELKTAVFALADGTLSAAQIAERIGTSRASVNAIVQRHKLRDKVPMGVLGRRRKVNQLVEAQIEAALKEGMRIAIFVPIEQVPEALAAALRKIGGDA